uniref:F-box protein At5g07610-like n=1 Tax=Erigeron canadensis TaxID=72917 RepID=UPI001CB9010A|nr:F-box protein At5g07610-like [Erigeron canadensis]
MSSAEKVASCDGLTSEILLRLPVRSLLHFKSVSKHWYSLISSSSFKLPNLDPPSGLFVADYINKPNPEYDFIPFDIESPVKPPLRALHFDPTVKCLMIEHSCNGLMLCSAYTDEYFRHNNKYVMNYKYYIYNPTINKFNTLPRLENYANNGSVRYGMTLHFDPTQSSHYKVIYVCGYETNPLTGNTRYQIEIYSSQTRTCKTSCEFELDEDIYIDFRAGVFWNNALHWIQKSGFIFCFNLDQEIVHQIQTPIGPIGGWVEEENYSNYLFESRDHLLVIEIQRPHTSKFKIHDLKKDYSEWFVKYNVDLGGISGSFPEIMNPESADTFEFAILALVLGDKEDESFLVLEIHGKALRFNLLSKTFHKLHDLTSSRPKSHSSNRNEVFRQWPCVFQFVESLGNGL